MTSGWTSAASVQVLAQAGRKLGPRGQAHLMPSARDDTPSPPTSRVASRVPSYAWMETVRRAANSFTEPRERSHSPTTTVIDNKTFHSIMPSILQDASEDTMRNSHENGRERPGSANNSDPGHGSDNNKNHDFDRNYDGPNRSSQSSVEINLSSRNHPDSANRLRASKPTIRFS